MSILDYVLIGLVVSYSLYVIFRKKKTGCSGCCASCSGCCKKT